MFTFSIADLFGAVKLAHQEPAEGKPVEWYGYTWQSYYTGEWIVLDFIQANERGGVQVKMMCGNGTIRDRWVSRDELHWNLLSASQVTALRQIGALS